MLIASDFFDAYGFFGEERPPQLWEPACSASGLRELVDGLVGALDEPQAVLTLNLANVVVLPEAAGEGMPAGEYVAITLRGDGGWARDGRWWRGGPMPQGLLGAVADTLDRVGASIAYTRFLGVASSATVLFPRA